MLAHVGLGAGDLGAGDLVEKAHAAGRGPDLAAGDGQLQQPHVGIVAAALEPARGDGVPQLLELGLVVRELEPPLDPGIELAAALGDEVHRLLGAGPERLHQMRAPGADEPQGVVVRVRDLVGHGHELQVALDAQHAGIDALEPPPEGGAVVGRRGLGRAVLVLLVHLLLREIPRGPSRGVGGQPGRRAGVPSRCAGGWRLRRRPGRSRPARRRRWRAAPRRRACGCAGRRRRRR